VVKKVKRNEGEGIKRKRRGDRASVWLTKKRGKRKKKKGGVSHSQLPSTEKLKKRKKKRKRSTFLPSPSQRGEKTC